MPWEIIIPLVAVQLLVQIITVTLLIRRKPENYQIWIALAVLGSFLGATISLIYVLTRPKKQTEAMGSISPESVSDLYA